MSLMQRADELKGESVQTVKSNFRSAALDRRSDLLRQDIEVLVVAIRLKGLYSLKTPRVLEGGCHRKTKVLRLAALIRYGIAEYRSFLAYMESIVGFQSIGNARLPAEFL